MLALAIGAAGQAQAAPVPADACAEPAESFQVRGVLQSRAQRLIGLGRHDEAIALFTCVLARDPHALHAYRGRAEARLMQGRIAAAFADYARITAYVIPTRPQGYRELLESYASRRQRDPDDRAALVGESFARWTMYDFEPALPLLDRLLDLEPDSVYALAMRGSSRLFLGQDDAAAMQDLERAIALAPQSADVRYIVADAYTYAHPDPARAFDEATRALQGGLDTPRVHAILATSHFAAGDVPQAARHLQRHFDLVTTQSLRHPEPLQRGDAVAIPLVPGRAVEFALPVAAGETVSIRTASPDFEIYDSIAVLLTPDGRPVAGNDDFDDFFAGFDWTAPASATYRLHVTSFEGVGTGRLDVERL